MTQLTAGRLQLAATAALLAFAVQVAFAQENTATVAPSGTLRAAFLGGVLNGGAALILLLWTVIAGAAAIRWFKWN